MLAVASTALIATAQLPEQYRAYLPDGSLRLDEREPSAASDDYDRRVFRLTRALEGTERWKLAAADGGPGVIDAFRCAIGVSLPKARVPGLVRLLSRYRTDLLDRTRLQSPAVPPGRGALCLAGKPLTMAREAPAIQSAWGWSVGLILAEALPERAAPIMARARAYGDSAAICGFTRATTVRDGRELAAVLFARMRAEPEFSADLAAAIADVRLAAATGVATDPASCAAEAETLAHPL